MAKERQYQKKRKRNIKIAVFSILLLIMAGFGIFFIMKNSTTSDEIVVNNDLSAPPSHKDFIGYRFYENLEKLPISFTFVSDEVSLLENYFTKTQYDYVSSSGILFYKGLPNSLLTGTKCSQQQLIRFTFCKNNYDKSSCTEDIFANLWLVNTASDYPNFNAYNPGGKFSEPFYYTYSCYESEKYALITVPDNVENRYLYDNKCINAQDPKFKYGTDYYSEFKCLEALKVKLEQDTTQTCTVKTYDDYICNNDRVYQKERQTDCTIDYTEYVKRCDYGCKDGACLDKPVETCVYKEYDDYKCIDDINYQLVQNRNCDKDYTNPIGACGTKTTTTPEEQEDTKTTPEDTSSTDDTTQTTVTNTTTTTTSSGGGGGVVCSAYEIKKDGDCSFSIEKSFTTKGFLALWDEKPLTIVLGIIIILIIIVVLIPTKKQSGGKKK